MFKCFIDKLAKWLVLNILINKLCIKVGRNNIGAPKMQNNLGAIKYSIFSNIAIAILDFSLLLPIKLSLFLSLLHFLHRFCTLVHTFLYFPVIVVALKNLSKKKRKTLREITITIIGRAITIEKAINKRRKEVLHKKK